MAGIVGPLIQAAVAGIGGGLRGQNEGDQLALENRAQERRLKLAEEESARRAGLVEAQIAELNRRQHEYVPTTKQEAIDYELATHPERLQRPEFAAIEHRARRLADGRVVEAEQPLGRAVHGRDAP